MFLVALHNMYTRQYILCCAIIRASVSKQGAISQQKVIDYPSRIYFVLSKSGKGGKAPDF